MELTITNNREIRPYKTAVKQYESGTTSLVFTREGYMYDQVDLRGYKAYAVTSIRGVVDMTELTYKIVRGDMVITWVISEQTLRQAGNITYQIVFKEDDEDGENTGVFYTYEAIIQNSASIDADNNITANYPTILKQWLDLIQNLAGTIESGIVYMPVGQPTPINVRLSGRVYYQIENADTYEGHFEDHLGNEIGAPICKHSVDANINKLISNGEYICTGSITNAPISCGFCVVRVTDSPVTNRVLQEVYVVDENNKVRTFKRAITGFDVFGVWTELADRKVGNIGNMVVITDVNGNLMENTVIRNVDLYGIEGFDLSKGTFQVQLNNKVAQSDFEDHIQANNAAIDTINQTLDAVQISSDIIEQAMVQHAQNTGIHVSPTDREKWNAPAFPVGSLLPSVRSSMEGWLLCDGSTYNTSDYPDLSTALGATGSTFKVPDFRNRTLWGASDAKPVKSVIDAGAPDITGTIGNISVRNVESNYSGFNEYSGAFTQLEQTTAVGFFDQSASAASGASVLNFSAGDSNPIYGKADTIQPPAIAVNFFIKY